MSIFKSGLLKPVLVTCVKPFSASSLSFEEGKNYEMTLDIGTMYILKTPTGGEAVVPKEYFVMAKEESNQV